MALPADLSYTSEHEWVKDPSGPTARVGVTEYAANQMGDVIFVDLPAVGSAVTAGTQCGEIESTKSVSELFSPVTGTISAVNDAVVNSPETVNTDPFGEGWLIEVAVDAAPTDLLDASAYAALTDAA